MKARGAAVFIRMASRPIPRVLRMMKVARDLGYDSIFCGAFRETGLSGNDSWGGWPVVRVGRYFPLLNSTRPLLYLWSMFSFNFGAYRLLTSRKPRLVHASDFETMPAAILFSLVSKAYLVYNIHDNVAQRYNLPSLLVWVLNAVEGVWVMAADKAIVPEEFRRQALPRWCRQKVSVIRNTPEDPGFTEPSFDGDSAIRIFFGGWIDWGRGLSALISMAERNPEFEFRLAGEGSPEIIGQLQRYPAIQYLGFLDHATVIEETRNCHFVPVLYDPARTINRFAASNKLAEALSVGRPVILNNELEITRSFEGKSCVIPVRYANAAQIGGRLKEMFANRQAYLTACREARQIYEEKYAWESVRGRIEGVLSGF